MMLKTCFVSFLEKVWNQVFSRSEALERALSLALGIVCCFRKKMLSRVICTLGRKDKDWSADYKFYSRSKWEEKDLYGPVIDEYLNRYKKGPIVIPMDDTKCKKSGKKIKTASYHRDPMSPPFHVNLMYGLRFMQAALSFPHYTEGDYPSRTYPVRFVEVPVVKKPGKRASEEERQEYKKLIKEKNLSTAALEIMKDLRKSIDEKGGAERKILIPVDGSMCNKTIFKEKLDRIDILARCRKDARLCFPVNEGERGKYAKEKWTPEDIRNDKKIPYKKIRVYYGGKYREIKYKEVQGVLWQRGAGERRLRLIVLAPLPYKLSVHARVNYRDPAYLLCTDVETDINILIQAYFDRWEIEVNHREEKSIFGISDAQVRSEKSVSRNPAFSVAVYSLLLLVGYMEYGPGRTSDYVELPKWRKNARRPSISDLQTLLRKECDNETSNSRYEKGNLLKNAALHAAG